MVTLPNEISVTTGSSTPVRVPRQTVDALKQFGKPVMIDHVEMDVDGARVAMQGYTFHNRSEGVHNHYCGLFVISVTGDEQITITLL